MQRPAGRRLREIELLVKSVRGRDPTSAEFDVLLQAQHECLDIEDACCRERIGHWARRLAYEIAELTE